MHRPNVPETLKEAEAPLAASPETAAGRVRPVSELLAKLGHEMRSPLSAIVGFSEILNESRSLSDEDRACNKRISENSRYLLNLLSDMMDLAKLEADEFESVCEGFALRDLVHALEVECRPWAEAENLRLEIRSLQPVPEYIYGDRARLHQILFNLLGHAVKRSAEGVIRVQLDYVAGLEQRGSLRVLVEDSAETLSFEDQALAFEPFAQTESKRSGSGSTKLGLSVARSIARSLGGEVAFENRRSPGSRLLLTLEVGVPAGVRFIDHPQAVAPSDPTTPSGVDVDLSGLRILIADDAADSQRLISHHLTAAGAACVFVNDGQEAMDVLMDSPGHFDLVLMDMNMPRVDGFQATRSLHDRGCQTPIMALTAYTEVGARERCFQSGCIDVVTKPAVPQLLLEQIAGVVGRDAPSKPMDETTKDLDSSELPEQLIERYRQRLSGVLQDLEESYETSDSEELMRHAHRLKGTGSAYGFPKLSAAAARLEEELLAPSHDPMEIRSGFQALVAEIQEIVQRD